MNARFSVQETSRPVALTKNEQFKKIISEVYEPMQFPLITSKSWAIFNSTKGTFLAGKDEK